MPSIWFRLQKYFGGGRLSIYICLLIAFIAWFLTKMSQVYHSEIVYPVAYLLPPDRAFLASPPSVVHTELRADGWTLLKLALYKEDDSLQVITAAIHDGSFNTRLALTNNLRRVAGDEIELLMITPGVIDVDLVEKAQRKLPVALGGEILMADQYQLRDSLQFTPDSVIVYGPTISLDSLQRVVTIPLDASELTKDLTQEINLASMTNGITLERTSVQLHIPVEQITEKELPIEIHLVDSLREKVQIFPDQALLKCIVGLSRFDDVLKDDFHLVAVPAMNDQAKTLPLVLMTSPNFVHSITFTPTEVEFFHVNP